MPRARLLRILALLVCAIAVLHIAAIALYLYWTLWWYDMVLHFLGGLFIALLVAWLYFYSGYLRPRVQMTRLTFFLLALASAFAFGVGWEFFEAALGNTWSVEGYWLDTITDVLLDVAGGLAGFLFLARHYLHHGA